jgi:hypothetical protein
MGSSEMVAEEGRIALRVGFAGHPALRRFVERVKAIAAECAPVVLGLLIALAASWLPPF